MHKNIQTYYTNVFSPTVNVCIYASVHRIAYFRYNLTPKCYIHSKAAFQHNTWAHIHIFTFLLCLYKKLDIACSIPKTAGMRVCLIKNIPRQTSCTDMVIIIKANCNVCVCMCYRLTVFHSPVFRCCPLGAPPPPSSHTLSHTHTRLGRNERIAALVTLQYGNENILLLPRATAATEGEMDWRKEKTIKIKKREMKEGS